MPAVKCDNCGSGVDVTKDGDWGHCASCNNIIEIKKQPDESSEGAKETGNETKTDEAGEKVSESVKD